MPSPDQRNMTTEEAKRYQEMIGLLPPMVHRRELQGNWISEQPKYISSKCIGGRHTDCVTQDSCTCTCHPLDGMAREVLTRMCEHVEFRRIMIDLVHKQTMREERLK